VTAVLSFKGFKLLEITFNSSRMRCDEEKVLHL